MSESVLQPWVEELPWKQQSILFSGLRGPDHGGCPVTKRVQRWMRAASQENADPSKPYMSDPGRDNVNPVSPKQLAAELEYLPCHFVHHLADALAVIAYNHPDRLRREAAYRFHYEIAEELFHFIPEPPNIFVWRHRDKKLGVDPEPEKPYDDRPWVKDLLVPEYRR